MLKIKLQDYITAISFLSPFYGEREYCKVEYGNFIKDKYTRTLRLKSKLFDLRVGYANPATSSPGEIPRTSHQKKNHPIRVRVRWFLVTRTGIEPMLQP